MNNRVKIVEKNTTEIGYDGGCGTCVDCQEGIEDRRASIRQAKDGNIFVIVTTSCEICGDAAEITKRYKPGTYELESASYMHGSYGGQMVIVNQ